MKLYFELEALIDALNVAGIEYALCGGLAVAMHGYVRFTQDIDLMARESDVPRILQAVLPLGFTFEEGLLELGWQTDPDNLVRLFRVSKALDRELLTLDLLLTGPAEADRWQDLVWFEWQGRKLPVVSLRVLAAMKRRSGRPRDLLDLNELGISDADFPNDSPS